MAHLLSGSIEQAESATLEAIDAWDPETESDEVLLQHGVALALHRVPSDTIDK